MSQRIITFTTDFGLTDHYVGTMKGVIYGINPDARIVDICNSVQSFDVLDGALSIAQAYNYFPSDTIHLVVVDPGVGSSRRPLLVTADKHIFVAPDNGVLSFVYERSEAISARHITSEHYFLQPVSSTFHGRDIFAAVAAWVSKGVQVAKFGEEITDYVHYSAPKPKTVNDKLVKGIVLKVDKFGNLITNITPKDLPQIFGEQPPTFKILVGKHEISKMKSSYADGSPGEIFGILDSLGYLEIATNRGVAANIVGATKGSEVGIVFEQPQQSAVVAY